MILVIVYSLLVSMYVLDLMVEWLNLKASAEVLPSEFRGYYDEEKYKKSQVYLKQGTYFDLVKSTLSLGLFIAATELGLFQWVDEWSRQWGRGLEVTGMIYIGVLTLGIFLFNLPFSIFDTFVLEEKFGFNRTTFKTFVFDQLKGALLALLIGVPVLYFLLRFFHAYGDMAWIFAWFGVSAFQLLLFFLAPVLILPLFNKYSPLGEGDLKSAIESFAQSQHFKISGIFTMDGSKRSSKANAFFTGFGRFKRIVLFDTLISQHTVKEIVAVLAHEIGHYKKRHVFRLLSLSLISSALMFYIFGLFLKYPKLTAAFGIQEHSIYAAMVFFGVFYSPISKIISLLELKLSRDYEFEADAYAKQTTQDPKSLATALKKLSVETLSNLTPHPLKVWFDYSHPPVLQRVSRLNAGMSSK